MTTIKELPLLEKGGNLLSLSSCLQHMHKEKMYKRFIMGRNIYSGDLLSFLCRIEKNIQIKPSYTVCKAKPS